MFFPLQPEQHGSQVSPVTKKGVVVLRVPSLFEVRCVGCVVKLIDNATAEKVHNYLGGDEVVSRKFAAGICGPDNLGFPDAHFPSISTTDR